MSSFFKCRTLPYYLKLRHCRWQWDGAAAWKGRHFPSVHSKYMAGWILSAETLRKGIRCRWIGALVKPHVHVALMLSFSSAHVSARVDSGRLSGRTSDICFRWLHSCWYPFCGWTCCHGQHFLRTGNQEIWHIGCTIGCTQMHWDDLRCGMLMHFPKAEIRNAIAARKSGIVKLTVSWLCTCWHLRKALGICCEYLSVLWSLQ